ncbi:MAG TPA: glycosyltransferase, partial [Fimbriimonadaceae bacterium]|nr:glycosyltransferase [Fimbriimonadaceae bacterium]
VLSFETIEHLENPETFLKALKSCPGTIAISTPNRETYSLGNEATDKPLNPFHTIEWSCSEFVDLIRSHFTGRKVEFLSQQAAWPGTIRPGVDENCAFIIAVIGPIAKNLKAALPIPAWPRLGVSVPTHNGSIRCRDLVVGMTRYYPGDLKFAIVDNASRHVEALALDQLHQDFATHVDVLHLTGNVGYGIGANTGLDFLWQQEWFDYFCVSNDDVLPAVDCLSQMVCAMKELDEGGHKPGVIGPVTNSISGAQKVDVGLYQSYAQMIDFAELWHRDHHSIVTQVNQLRGLFMLIHPDCLSAIGGFDPLFGIGNFEDDDYNLRTRFAGFTTWIAEGAFLHHAGSSTFGEMKVDYEASITRNLQLICEKWGFADFNEFVTISEKPKDVKLYVPLRSSIDMSGYVITLGTGEHIDLIRQASDVEFAAYIHNRMQGRPREERIAIIELLEKTARSSEHAA